MQLDTICRKCKVPLLIARSYGLVGYLRVGHEHSLHNRPCCIRLLDTHFFIVYTLMTMYGVYTDDSEDFLWQAGQPLRTDNN